MSLSQADLKKYGLTSVDGGSIDDGVIQSGSNFYKVDNFERQQKDGLDTDQGDVFKSSLEADSGVDFTNFNTINDVQGAIQALEGNATDDSKAEQPVVQSPRLAHARARIAQHEKDVASGQYARDLYTKEETPAESFLDRYKLNLGEKLASGYYVKPEGM